MNQGTYEHENSAERSGRTDLAKSKRPESKPTPFATRVTPEIQRQLKARCAELGIRMQDAVDAALSGWLHSHSKSSLSFERVENIDPTKFGR